MLAWKENRDYTQLVREVWKLLSYKSFILTLFSFFISYALHAQVANYVTSDSKENWNIYSETRVKSLQHLPKNEPLPEDVIYRDVNADQWKLLIS